MNLKLVTTGNNGFEIFDHDKMVINIKTDQDAKAFRITCNEKRRVFFIEEGDAKSNLDVMINEYSQPLGFLHRLKNKSNSGLIETEGIKYIYSISIKSSIEVMLFTNYDKNPEISCIIEKNPGLRFIDGLEIKYILFSLTWFLFSNAEKKKVLEYAEA